MNTVGVYVVAPGVGASVLGDGILETGETVMGMSSCGIGGDVGSAVISGRGGRVVAGAVVESDGVVAIVVGAAVTSTGGKVAGGMVCSFEVVVVVVDVLVNVLVVVVLSSPLLGNKEVSPHSFPALPHGVGSMLGAGVTMIGAGVMTITTGCGVGSISGHSLPALPQGVGASLGSALVGFGVAGGSSSALPHQSSSWP